MSQRHTKKVVSSDSILLKIHRQYGHEEAFAHLESEIKMLRFQVGQMHSENQHVNFQVENRDRVIEKLRAENSGNIRRKST